MSMSMAPTLPLDVILNIVEESANLSRSRYKLLRAFASTCRALRPEALKHIYRAVRLIVDVRFGYACPGVYDLEWQSMAKMVEADPSIAVHVKEVMFLLSRAGNLPPGLVSLLGQFANVGRIDCGHSMNPRYLREQQWVEWSNLSESSRQGWRTVFQMPTSLLIQNFRGIPVSELQLCKRLARLSFDIDSFVVAPDNFTPGHFIPLQELRAEAPFGSIAPLFLIANQHDVTTLNFRRADPQWTDVDCEQLQGFPKLTGLQICLKLDDPSFFHHLAPGVVQNLDYFALRIRLDDSVKSGVLASTLIAGAKEPGFQSLKVFKLEIRLEYIGFTDETVPEFERLDRLFASCEVFPALQELHMTLQVGPYWGSISAMRDWSDEDTTRHMPLASARLGEHFYSKMTYAPSPGHSPLPLE